MPHISYCPSLSAVETRAKSQPFLNKSTVNCQISNLSSSPLGKLRAIEPSRKARPIPRELIATTKYCEYLESFGVHVLDKSPTTQSRTQAFACTYLNRETSWTDIHPSNNDESMPGAFARAEVRVAEHISKGTKRATQPSPSSSEHEIDYGGAFPQANPTIPCTSLYRHFIDSLVAAYMELGSMVCNKYHDAISSFHNTSSFALFYSCILFLSFLFVNSLTPPYLLIASSGDWLECD
jgi:hypothetical protein